MILFMGGVAGLIGMALCPIPKAWMFCWVPPLLDLGCVPAVVAIVRGPSEEKGDADANKGMQADC